MVHPITIIKAEVDYPDGVILSFSDGTTAAFLVEEMLELRPYREPTEYTEEIAEERPHPQLSLVRGFPQN